MTHTSAPAAAPVAVQATGGNIGGLRLVYRGVYDAASRSVASLQPQTSIWTSGGRIFRASVAAGGPPVPVQVSSETNIGDASPLTPTATHFCDAEVVTDWSDPLDSRWFYTLAGSDRACGGGDGVVKRVRLGAAVSDAPVTLMGRRVAEIRVGASGGIGGWLAVTAVSTLVATDAAFANPMVVQSGVGYARLLGRHADDLLLSVQSGSSVAVRRFVPAAGTLPACKKNSADLTLNM